MSSKQSPKTKTAAASKPKASSSKIAPKVPQPESVERFWGEAICVICFTSATEDAFGAKLLGNVISEMNKLGIDFVFQDERSVVNLSARILAIRT